MILQIYLEEYDPTVEGFYRKQLSLNVPSDHYDKNGSPINAKSIQTVEIDILDPSGGDFFELVLFLNHAHA